MWMAGRACVAYLGNTRMHYGKKASRQRQCDALGNVLLGSRCGINTLPSHHTELASRPVTFPCLPALNQWPFTPLPPPLTLSALASWSATLLSNAIKQRNPMGRGFLTPAVYFPKLRTTRIPPPSSSPCLKKKTAVSCEDPLCVCISIIT
ncbi:hypothetical protein JZ751_026503 [Albula glossodonta]|uniref:Uncharacterized protein n=1 Tax=Albula glossodonta TaxID=121402 RepID=A0A8T2PDN0_9TELE|nr:hypothetical protein JZ751_026503 [Albula glossodonta]